MIFVTPVGPYFKEGFKPVKVQIIRDYDRAAPLGTGHIKVGGNYAASLIASERAHAEGFSTVIFLDAKEKKYIDEAGPANFFGIKDGKYVTPESNSILPSITNKSLTVIAEDLGLVVERRHIRLDEIGTFEEAGACGTAAVISPIRMVQDRTTGTEYVISKDGQPGPWSIKMREMLMGIQSLKVFNRYLNIILQYEKTSKACHYSNFSCYNSASFFTGKFNIPVEPYENEPILACYQ